MTREESTLTRFGLILVGAAVIAAGCEQLPTPGKTAVFENPDDSIAAEQPQTDPVVDEVEIGGPVEAPDATPDPPADEPIVDDPPDRPEDPVEDPEDVPPTSGPTA